MDWGDFLNETAQQYVGSKVAAEVAPDVPVSVNQATGQIYREGQPAASNNVFGIKPQYLLGAAAGLVLLLVVMRMRQ